MSQLEEEIQCFYGTLRHTNRRDHANGLNDRLSALSAQSHLAHQIYDRYEVLFGDLQRDLYQSLCDLPSPQSSAYENALHIQSIREREFRHEQRVLELVGKWKTHLDDAVHALFDMSGVWVRIWAAYDYNEERAATAAEAEHGMRDRRRDRRSDHRQARSLERASETELGGWWRSLFLQKADLENDLDRALLGSIRYGSKVARAARSEQ